MTQLDELQRQFKDKEAALERAESWLSWLTGAARSLSLPPPLAVLMLSPPRLVGLAIILIAVLAAVAAYFVNLHHRL